MNIAALDPGRDKCGFAILAKDGRVIWQKVIETARLEAELADVRTTIDWFDTELDLSPAELKVDLSRIMEETVDKFSHYK